MSIEFHVEGDPATKGSWRGVRSRSTGRVVMKPDNEREAGWAELVTLHARQAMARARAEKAPSAPFRVELDFRVQRPAKSAFPFPPRGDVDKLARSVLDALTGVVYDDDKQVVQLLVEKHWDAEAGVFIRAVPVAEVALPNLQPAWSSVA